MLRDLQEELVGHMAFVFYAAPAFVFANWDTLALNRQVADNSIFIPPMELAEVVPGDPHCFAYTGLSNARAFSEPASVQPVSLGSVLDIAASASVRRDRREPELLGDYLRRVYGVLITAGQWENAPRYQSPRSVALAASRVDVQPLTIGPVPGSAQ